MMPEQDLSPAKLRTLYNMLGVYAAEIRKEQPLAAQIIEKVRSWVEAETRYDT